MSSLESPFTIISDGDTGIECTEVTNTDSPMPRSTEDETCAECTEMSSIESPIPESKPVQTVVECTEMNSPESPTAVSEDDSLIQEVVDDDLSSARNELEASIRQSKVLLSLIQEEKRSLNQMVARQVNINALNQEDIILLRTQLVVLKKQLEKLKIQQLPLIKKLHEQNVEICKFINEKTKEMYVFLMTSFEAPNFDSEETAEISPEMANLTLADLIEKLICRWEDSPDPYIDVDQAVWPPHVELLLRVGIIQRHTDDPTKICLLPYD